MPLGRNWTESEQLAPASRSEPHELDIENSPETVMLNSCRGELPLLVSVTVKGRLKYDGNWLPKSRDVWERLTSADMPVPARCILAGIPGGFGGDGDLAD
jgi:hypothetical protein